MREANSKTTTSDEVAIRLKELETRHHEEIQKLFDLATGDYFSRVMDAYQSVDGGIDLPELDVSPHRSIYPTECSPPLRIPEIPRDTGQVRNTHSGCDRGVPRLPLRVPPDTK